MASGRSFVGRARCIGCSGAYTSQKASIADHRTSTAPRAAIDVTDADFELDLPRGPRAPGIARRSLEDWLRSMLGDDEMDDVKLIASELVTNAVVHGRGQIALRAHVDDDRVRVEVIDEGHGFEHVVRRVPFEQLCGRGLAIVDDLAGRWGIHEGTTHVWFEVERPGPRVGADRKPHD
jgi:anti-sigma regulatory factor (Ser/Thr protein kinase)